MSSEGKKITFSFSKVKKPALVKKIDTEPKEKIDYVDCFDGSKGKFSYKGNIRNDETHKQELVIPMPSTKTSLDILKSRIEEKEKKNLEISETNKVEIKDSEDGKISQNHPKNLEELATLEILNDIKNDQINNKAPSKLIIEAKDVPPEASEHDIDYENVPVTEFGLALLRGMGWRPDEGIGKEPRIIEAQSPVLRPKGLGLGAKLNTEVENDEKNTKKSKDSNSSSISQKHKSRSKEHHIKNKSEIYKK